MKATIVIPSYWARPSDEPLNLEDAVYDHPTPVDLDGTLPRALESIALLENSNYNVVVIACATHPDIAARVEEKVSSIVTQFDNYYPVTCISHTFEDRIRKAIVDSEEIDDSNAELISLVGYSNIRNMCLLSALLCGSDVAVLFDDDEVYEDHAYLDKVFESMDARYEGKPVRALAGYYLQPEGSYLLPPPRDWWMAEWPMVDSMNEAFTILAGGSRLEKTPFVFGGNMVVHKDVIKEVPFDPNVRRGEDIDHLINCKFFDIDFILDDKLAITHLPPKTHVPPWQHFRENIFRFIYERAKLRAQVPLEGIRRVEVEELDPYPGRCLRDDLEELVFRTSVLIALRHMELNDDMGFRESMRNISIARYEAPPDHDPFIWYLDFQKRWRETTGFLEGNEELSRELLGST